MGSKLASSQKTPSMPERTALWPAVGPHGRTPCQMSRNSFFFALGCYSQFRTLGLRGLGRRRGRVIEKVLTWIQFRGIMIVERIGDPKIEKGTRGDRNAKPGPEAADENAGAGEPRGAKGTRESQEARTVFLINSQQSQ